MSMKRWLLFATLIGLIASCSPAPDPQRVITLGDPIDFVHSSNVFALRVPGGWRAVEDSVETEAFASFTDPNGWASLTAYAGLLDRRFSEDEGLSIAGGVAENLLGRPDEYQVIDRQRRTDGGFAVTFTFLSDSYRRKGRAVFYDRDLALAGTIITGTEADWDAVEGALKPFADSFRLNPEAVQGAYFLPLLGPHYGLAVPAGWSQREYGESVAIRAPSRDMSILAIETDGGQTPDTDDALVEQAMRALRRMGVEAQPLDRQPVSDGRLRVTLDGGRDRVVGYVERLGALLVGLFFQAPADRVGDYQPFMDFVYSTFITEPP